ncbi:expressed protein [Echinococcus multilocularis]|uniref:Expressed protein n=1 Tax=Echinococcus multilocularis TaxID=6211 RepID=A0A068YMV1_ECHMU|nr:expressed protein [Echinococcus multilocularis]
MMESQAGVSRKTSTPSNENQLLAPSIVLTQVPQTRNWMGEINRLQQMEVPSFNDFLDLICLPSSTFSLPTAFLTDPTAISCGLFSNVPYKHTIYYFVNSTYLNYVCQ